MSRFVVTGASGGSPNRLEINDLVNNEKFFSLYIQALQAMSDYDQDNIQSYFAVAGIHGLPSKPWDGATGDPPFDPTTDQWGGYCTHGSVVFPTWHRPHLMLFEQILQRRAEEIAATYTVDAEDWMQAATNLRQPFWDWAKNAVPPEQVIALPQVTITGKDGKQIQVDNPLYHYKFHPIDPSFEHPYSSWQTTLRLPASEDPNATDDVATLKNVLASAQSGITLNTYNMLTRVKTWPAFSNHTKGDDGSASNSLESIHDGIHAAIGGHMADPSVGGFDPIFFLHHANVDRLLSMWAAINPGVWVSAGIADSNGSFTTLPGAPVDQTTALTPFWNSQTTFWSSTVTAVGDTSKLGYTYPDFNGVDVRNTDATRTAISNLVNELYGSSVFRTFSLFANTAKKVPAASSSHYNPAAPQQHPLPTQQVTDLYWGHWIRNLTRWMWWPQQHEKNFATPDRGQIWDWTARVEFKKYELGTSFSVFIFLNQVPENPRDWRVSPYLVGGHHAFVNSTPIKCANCRNQRNIVVEGFVHLNHAIAERSGLGSLEPNVVEPYLTNNLYWRVQKSNGEVAELESLEVAVIATPLSFPPGSIFPVPGQARRHNGITYGRPGGSRHINSL